MLVEQPDPITDQIWVNLLPQLVPLLEENEDEEHSEKMQQQQERQDLLFNLLQALKPEINPFRGLLEELGFNPSQLSGGSTGGSKPLRSLVDYPFPNCATILQLTCLGDIKGTDMSGGQIEELLQVYREEVEQEVADWREQGEQQLVDCWNSDEFAGGVDAPSAPGGTVETQTSNTNFLLRADTVFSYRPPIRADGQQQHHHYPDLAYTYATSDDSKWPSDMVKRLVYRHLEAEKCTKGILGRHEMPDATYCELKVLGASFVCERCEDKGPKTWDGMLDHYIGARKLYDWLRRRAPIIQTTHPIVFRNNHDPSLTEKRFVSFLRDQEPGVPIPTLNISQMWDCMLCKNHHYRRTTRTMGDMEAHLRDVHEVSWAVYGVAFESSDKLYHFHERGKKWSVEWKREWDAYCDANL